MTDTSESDEPNTEKLPSQDPPDGEIRAGKLAGRSMWGAIWILALPVLLQQLLTACVGLFDKILGGSLPEEIVLPAMDGLSVGSFVGWFVAIAMSGLGIGGQALIARAMGKGDQQLAERALGTALTLALIWGAIVGVVLFFGIGPLCELVKLDPLATRYAREYVQILAFSMPFCSAWMVASMCFYGAGETVLPSIISVAMNVVNVVASWAFSGIAIRMGEARLDNPFPIDPASWGVQGIAAGTAVAWAFASLAAFILLKRGVKDMRLETHRLRPESEISWRIVRVGLPLFFEGLAMWMANFFVLRFIGDIAVRFASEGRSDEGLQGSHIIAIQWEAFSFLPGFAIGTAAGALAGQYLGAGNSTMARRAIIACTLIAILIMGSLGVIFMLFGESLTRIISDQPAHLETVPKLLFICGATEVFFAITMVVRQGLRGVGDTRWTLLITTFSSYGIRLPVAWLLGVYMGYGLTGIWIGLCGEIVIRAILFSARFFNGGWTRITV